MSYGLGIAGDARADLRGMETWLQEEFWDELERLAADPSILPTHPLGGDITYEFTRDSHGLRHVVRMTLSRNDTGKTLTVLGITDQQRTISE